jgi:hypothetical protein
MLLTESIVDRLRVRDTNLNHCGSHDEPMVPVEAVTKREQDLMQTERQRNPEIVNYSLGRGNGAATHAPPSFSTTR